MGDAKEEGDAKQKIETDQLPDGQSVGPIRRDSSFSTVASTQDTDNHWDVAPVGFRPPPGLSLPTHVGDVTYDFQSQSSCASTESNLDCAGECSPLTYSRSHMLLARDYVQHGPNILGTRCEGVASLCEILGCSRSHNASRRPFALHTRSQSLRRATSVSRTNRNRSSGGGQDDLPKKCKVEAEKLLVDGVLDGMTSNDAPCHAPSGTCVSNVGTWGLDLSTGYVKDASICKLSVAKANYKRARRCRSLPARPTGPQPGASTLSTKSKIRSGDLSNSQKQDMIGREHLFVAHVSNGLKEEVSVDACPAEHDDFICKTSAMMLEASAACAERVDPDALTTFNAADDDPCQADDFICNDAAMLEVADRCADWVDANTLQQDITVHDCTHQPNDLFCHDAAVMSEVSVDCVNWVDHLDQAHSAALGAAKRCAMMCESREEGTAKILGSGCSGTPFIGQKLHQSQPDEDVENMKEMAKLLTFYFSEANLACDTYLWSLMDSDGWVSLSSLLTIPQVQFLGATEDLIFQALAFHPSPFIIELSPDGWSCRRRCMRALAYSGQHHPINWPMSVLPDMHGSMGSLSAEAPEWIPKATRSLAADGSELPPVATTRLSAQAPAWIPKGSEAHGQGKKKRRRGTQLKLATHLRSVESKDPACIFMAYRIHRLGYDSEAILHKHYQKYGPVEHILLSNEHTADPGFPCRSRPSGIAIIVMRFAEDAAFAVAAGDMQDVSGVSIRVKRFERRVELLTCDDGLGQKGQTAVPHMGDQEFTINDQLMDQLMGA